MKQKRRILVLALSFAMIFSSAFVVYAAYSTNSGSKTIYSNEYDMSLYGYIDLLQGELFIKDRYFYNVALMGDDVVYAVPKKNSKVYVKVKDDEGDTAVTVNPYYAAWYISSSVYYGYWSDYGKLDMRCYDVTGSVKGY